VKAGDLVLYTDDWGSEWICAVLNFEGLFTKVFVMGIPDVWFVYTNKLEKIEATTEIKCT